MRADRSRRIGFGRLLVAALAGALTTFVIIAGVQASSAIARSDMDLAQAVDRTLKGDRLPFSPAVHPVRVERFSRNGILHAPVLVLDTKLADGCEPLVSPLAHFRLGMIAGRCVS
jgi:hypothetical protein